MSMPDLLSVSAIQERLATIFPDGMQNRSYFTREMAARVVYVMLYIDAIEGKGFWLGPKHVYCMSNEQMALQSDESRQLYGENAWKPGYTPIGERWYADTTREPIRDETLRDGLVRVDAVVQRSDVATTSGKPRYALRRDFASLFVPSLGGEQLMDRIKEWQARYLDALALARMELLRQGVAISANKVTVHLPNGSTRQLSPGPSSVISKAVIEIFASRFLLKPGLILLSESGNKIIAQEEVLTRAVGLNIQADKLLPDIILFDLEPSKELLVFVEVVATDGPVSDARREALLRMSAQARVPEEQIAFVTAYLDRNQVAFKRTFQAVSWNSLVWFATEPEHIVVLREKPVLSTSRIFDLL